MKLCALDGHPGAEQPGASSTHGWPGAACPGGGGEGVIQPQPAHGQREDGICFRLWWIITLLQFCSSLEDYQR